MILIKKNKEENDKAQEIFSKKVPVITYILLGINILLFLITAFDCKNMFEISTGTIYKYGGLVNIDYLTGILDYSRVITSGFLHAGIIHLVFKMYAVYVIGPQLESFFGKVKYLIIYLGSIIFGNLLSLLFIQGNYISCGASGAIFGLLGALLYFGYHYRVYLGTVLKNQLIPIILLNLALGFLIRDVDNFAHIGGLIEGIMVTSSLGVKNKSTTFEKVNGTIITLIFTGIILYIAFVYSARG